MENFNTIYIPKSKIINCTSKGDAQKRGAEIEEFNLQQLNGRKHIAVIGAGMSAEREVSRSSSEGIVNSLIELGYSVTFIDMGADIAIVLAKIVPDIVFNALHGTYGEDGCLQGLLNIMRIPYTGTGVMTSSLALNKKKSHEIFKSNGIKVAEAICVCKSDNVKSNPMPRPYVIKPLEQGSSVGVEVIFEEDDFSFADYNFPYGDEIIVEKYIKGRELQVAVLDGESKGVLEIKVLEGKRFYDYEVKYTEGLADHLLPAPVPDHIREEALSVSERACKIFESTSGIIRVELIYSEEEDDIYMLELNTHPGMTPMSICPEIVATHGISYTDLVEKMLESASFEE